MGDEDAKSKNGGESDEEDGTPPVKKYCCGNETSFEAQNISIIDCTAAIFQVGFYSAPAILVIFKESILMNVAVANSYKDFIRFLELDLVTKLSFLLFMILYAICAIPIGITLYSATKEKDWKKLRLWFYTSIIQTIVFISVAIPVVIFVKEKWVWWSIWFIFLFLYKWYALWIVYLLIGEIREAQNRYIHPGDLVAGA